MTTRPRRTTIGLLCALATVAAGIGGSAAVAAVSPPVKPTAASPFGLVASVFPTATAVMKTEPTKPGHLTRVQLRVQLPAGTAVPAGTAAQKSAAYTADEWRLDLLGPLAARAQRDLVGYRLVYPHANRGVPRYAHSELRGKIYRSGPFAGGSSAKHDKKLDSIKYSLALRQERDSITTLSRVLGKHKLTAAVSEVPLGKPQRFAIAVSISVRDAGELKGHLGDVIDGLTTGFGDGQSSLIEGLAITVTANGNPLIGAWDTVRRDEGTLQFAKAFKPGDGFSETTHFRDITGGPNVTSTGLGL